MSTFLRASGRTSSSVLVRRVEVRRVRLNSAAQVSTRLNTGCRSCASRFCAISFSGFRESCAMRLSEKPSRFPALELRERLAGSDLALRPDQSSISRRNQGSMDESWAISLVGRPARYASPPRRAGAGGRLHFRPDPLHLLRAVLGFRENVAPERAVQAGGAVLQAAERLLQCLVERCARSTSPRDRFPSTS